MGSVVSKSSTVSTLHDWKAVPNSAGPMRLQSTQYRTRNNDSIGLVQPLISPSNRRNACVPMRFQDAQSETSSRKPYQKCVERRSIVLIAVHNLARAYRTASGRQCNRKSIQVTKLTSHRTATLDGAGFPQEKASQGDQHRFTFPKILTIRIRQRIDLS